jgi:hypothetical protein
VLSLPRQEAVAQEARGRPRGQQGILIGADTH